MTCCLAWMVLLLAAEGGAPVKAEDSYPEEVRKYRAEREQRLRAEDGWLTLIGLHWLATGENAFGSDPDNPVVLPGSGVPSRAGALIYDGRSVTLQAGPDVKITLKGRAVREQLLRDDSEGQADVLQLGSVSFQVIKRGERHAVRVKDSASAARREFRGLDYYPIDPRYRVRAVFEPYAEPREIAISTVLGTTVPMQAPGLLRFSLGGKEHTLQPLIEEGSGKELFIIFRDQTSGHETYGAGRYLYADLVDGSATIDFNRAYNPPCAFTSYATCPLPPRDNQLQVRIEAGEKTYGKH